MTKIKITNFIMKLLSFLSALVLSCTILVSQSVSCYAAISSINTVPDSVKSQIPDGYHFDSKLDNSNGTTSYICVPDEYNSDPVSWLGEVDPNCTISMSPQMTYALYGSSDGSTTDDNLENILSAAAAGNEISESMVKDTVKDFIDKSYAFSSAFSYSGVPDEDSYVATAVSHNQYTGLMQYANYFVCDSSGLSDWYANCVNCLGWNNVYGQDLFNNYNQDYSTFCLYNQKDDDRSWQNFTPYVQLQSNRFDNNGNVAVSDRHLIKFQNTATSFICSGMLIFDTARISINEETSTVGVLDAIAGGDYSSVLAYSDYAKLHANEEQDMCNNAIKSPVKSCKLSKGSLICSFDNPQSGHLGYYVDYLVFRDSVFRLYRHYFFPDDSVYKSGLALNGNTLETMLPFTNCTLDNKSDDTLILGIGFYNYWTNDGTVAELAPTLTAGMGDISFISSYTYYPIKYNFTHRTHIHYSNDFGNDDAEINSVVITVDNDSNTVVSTEHDVPVTVTQEPSVDTPVSDYGTYVDNSTHITYNIDGDYIENWQQNIENSDLSTGDKTNMQETTNNYTPPADDPDDDDDDDNPTFDDDEGAYWTKYTKWITSAKKFISDVPDLLSVLWSWMPEPLSTFVELSIATGFAVAVMKIVIRRD